jgi:23S rRNA-/tRNA-specific pseudouridylate synthase
LISWRIIIIIFLYRHEPPICGEIVFVGESIDYFAVSKPSSLPVHPCGAYRYNSLEFILKYDPLSIRSNSSSSSGRKGDETAVIPPPPQPLYLVHRLDR